MSVFQAVILGLVQGIAEFLPISSSGHLLLLHNFFSYEVSAGSMLTFDIMVHIGTLLALVAVFWSDIAALVKKPVQRMTGLLIVATIPAIVVGFLFKDPIEAAFNNGLMLAATFSITGVLLLIADRLPTGKKTHDEVSWLDAIIIGCMQAVGLPPGISRSGATITGSLIRGLTRETAAKFSFLLAGIAITGAGVLQGFDIIRDASALAAIDALPMLFGFAASALSGYLAVRWLLKLISSCRLRIFAYYVFALSVFLVVDHFFMNILFQK